MEGVVVSAKKVGSTVTLLPGLSTITDWSRSKSKSRCRLWPPSAWKFEPPNCIGNTTVPVNGLPPESRIVAGVD